MNVLPPPSSSTGTHGEANASWSLQTPHDAYLLGLRVEHPANRSAREVYAAFLGVEPHTLRATEGGGVWRWFASDRTVRWAPQEGAPWAWRKKATRDACESPRELWERLAARGILPPTWVDSVEREFFDLPARSEALVITDAPLTLELALRLASDVAGMVTAEALMREAISLLAPWGMPCPAKVRWSAFPTQRYWYAEGHAAVIPPYLADLVERTGKELARRSAFVTEFARGTTVPASRTFVAQSLLGVHLAWQQWCADDRRVPARREDWPPTREPRPRAPKITWGRCPPSLAGVRFRELADPTRPLLGIVALGYTPDWIRVETATILHRGR